MQRQPRKRVAGAFARHGVADQRTPRWFTEDHPGATAHFEAVRNAFNVR